MFREAVNELINFLLTDVKVWARSEPATTHGDYNPVFLLQVLLDLLLVVLVGHKRDDGTRFGRMARADYAITLATNALDEPIRQGDKSQ